MDQLDRTEGASRVRWDVLDRTTSSGRTSCGLVDERLTIPSVPYNRLKQPYEHATRSGRETDWERFVEAVAAQAISLTQEEGFWLVDTAQTAPPGYRAGAALARGLASIATSATWRTPALSALVRLGRHSSPEVRLQALEAAAEIDTQAAVLLAKLLRDDSHPAVQQAVRAVRAMR